MHLESLPHFNKEMVYQTFCWYSGCIFFPFLFNDFFSLRKETQLIS